MQPFLDTISRYSICKKFHSLPVSSLSYESFASFSLWYNSTPFSGVRLAVCCAPLWILVVFWGGCARCVWCHCRWWGCVTSMAAAAEGAGAVHGRDWSRNLLSGMINLISAMSGVVLWPRYFPKFWELCLVCVLSSSGEQLSEYFLQGWIEFWHANNKKESILLWSCVMRTWDGEHLVCSRVHFHRQGLEWSFQVFSVGL